MQTVSPPLVHGSSQASPEYPRPERRLTIVHAVAPAPFGGLERVVRSLASGQLAAGHRVHVAAVVGGSADHPFVSAMTEAGVPTAAITTGNRDYFGERRAVRTLCEEVGADILHTHGYRPDVVASGIATGLGIPRVSTVHGFTGGDWKNRLYERMQRYVLRRFDGVIAVARSQIGPLSAAGVPAERIHLLPNAWQPGTTLPRRTARAALGAPDTTMHVGWVGRLSHEKGADILLDALKVLGDLPLTVSVLGDGAERERLEGLAADLGIADRVRWHGALPDAGRYFSAFDLFVLSSRTEGTPMVLFEAMAAGVPIVASAVGGVPDVITSAEGWLVPAGDPLELAAAIRSAIADPSVAHTCARRAKTRLESEFALSTWLAGHEALYTRLLTRRA